MKQGYTPGPWLVIPDYAWQGKHPLHDARFVATSDQVEITDYDVDDLGQKAWRFVNPEDSIICTMPDSEHQKEHAKLIASAPELLNALELAQATIERLHRHAPGSANGTLDVIKAAISKATE